jgi:hypothetical protein
VRSPRRQEGDRRVYRELPAAPVLDAAAGLAAREFDTNAADTLVGRTFELEQIVNERFTL